MDDDAPRDSSVVVALGIVMVPAGLVVVVEDEQVGLVVQTPSQLYESMDSCGVVEDSRGVQVL